MSNLIYLKVDTTGTDLAKDRVVLISAEKVTGTKENENRETFHRYILPDGNWTIQKDASKVNGLTDEFILSNGEDPVSVLTDFNKFMNSERGNDIVTFNGLNFDIRFLAIEFSHYGVEFDIEYHRMFDLYDIEARNNANDFASTYLRHVGIDKSVALGQPIKKTTDALERLFWKMSKDYTRNQMLGDMNPTIYDSMNMYRMDSKGNLVFVRGKHPGQKVSDVIQSDPDYILFLFKNILTEKSKRIVINDYERRKKMVETEHVKC